MAEAYSPHSPLSAIPWVHLGESDEDLALPEFTVCRETLTLTTVVGVPSFSCPPARKETQQWPQPQQVMNLEASAAAPEGFLGWGSARPQL